MRCSSTSLAARLSRPSARWSEKSSYPTPLVARRSLRLADLVVVVTEDLDQALAVARVDRELAREEVGVRARRPAVRRALHVVAGDVALHATVERLGVGEADPRDLGRGEDRLRHH